MVALPKPITSEAFEAFIRRPENADRNFELINGEIVEVPSNTASSKIAFQIGRLIGNFVEEHDLGSVTGEAGGYRIGFERYAPDVAFIASPKDVSTEWFNPEAPDLVVEVDYPSTLQSRRTLSVKITNYLRAGVVVWAVYPDDRQVDVFVPNQPPVTLDENGVIDGGSVLPGFSLPVSKIFPKKDSE